MPKSNRVRLFAGPNGSGKSTLFNEFSKKFAAGVFINADDLEQQLNVSGFIDLATFGITASMEDINSFGKTKDAQLLISKAKSHGIKIRIRINENIILKPDHDLSGYEASFIASFIRWVMYKSKRSFSFETVLSHPSKLNELRRLKKAGYKNYLYFISTDDPDINVDRIAGRVKKGKHDVDETIVRSRFERSLKNAHKAIALCSRAYLFDNSGKQHVLIAEISDGIMQLKVNNLPQWFIKYILPFYS